MADEAETAIRALRQADPDRYLSILYAPADRRADLAALYLFNAEVAAIRDRAREPLPGEMRIQWWRDALAGGAEVAGHPVAASLLRVIGDRHLPHDAFERYLDARTFDLYDDPMPSRGDLEGYCGETASALVQLAALILESEAAAAFAAAAGHAGCAQAIAGLLLLLPLHRARGQCYFPADMLAAAGTDRDGFVSGADRGAARRAVAAMITLGREHAARFDELASGMPASLRPAFLPPALGAAWLARAPEHGFDPAEQAAASSALRKHWTLFSRATRGWG